MCALRKHPASTLEVVEGIGDGGLGILAAEHRNRHLSVLNLDHGATGVQALDLRRLGEPARIGEPRIESRLSEHHLVGGIPCVGDALMRAGLEATGAF